MGSGKRTGQGSPSTPSAQAGPRPFPRSSETGHTQTTARPHGNTLCPQAACSLLPGSRDARQWPTQWSSKPGSSPEWCNPSSHHLVCASSSGPTREVRDAPVLPQGGPSLPSRPPPEPRTPLPPESACLASAESPASGRSPPGGPHHVHSRHTSMCPAGQAAEATERLSMRPRVPLRGRTLWKTTDAFPGLSPRDRVAKAAAGREHQQVGRVPGQLFPCLWLRQHAGGVQRTASFCQNRGSSTEEEHH